MEKKQVMQQFAVQCPRCKAKDIREAKKRLISIQDKCKRCHSNTWLKVVGKIVKFGESGQFTKIVWFAENSGKNANIQQF